MHSECVSCFLVQADRMLEKHRIRNDVAKDIILRFRLFVDDHKDNNLTAPEASCFLHRLIKKASGTNDLYKKEKKHYNKLLLNLEEDIRRVIHNSENPFQTALRYALAGNIIDFGPPGQFDVFKALSSAVSKDPAIDHSGLLQKALKKAAKVLYLGDNAGEIVLDKLLVETIRHPNLKYAVRGGNIINDITMEDARAVGMTELTTVISNGYSAPSTLVNRCSQAFRKIYSEADLIISKGQGNLEGLIDETGKKIFFLLMIKCNVMAKITGANQGDVVILYNQKMSLPKRKTERL
ncbi:MAG: DUF89 family protein [Bacteroidales bacterium]|nr:DUF89 family protein [Bacteroidales bacterium]MBN2764014.1 DUF89 family protein [Bacteroidales bacterium]